MSERSPERLWWPEAGIWLALLALLGISLGSAYLRLGLGNAAANYGIATLKALLVAIVFMHLRSAGALIRLVAGAGLFWLVVFFALTFSDVLTR
jgi:cytochrome c oxidase subunit 4